MKANRAMHALCICLAVTIGLILSPGTSGARIGDVGVGGSLGFATSPGYSDLGLGIGFLMGGGYIVAGNFVPNRDDGIEVRGEIGYFNWSRSISSFGGSYNVSLGVVPLYALARYVFPINPELWVYGQAGFSINFVSITGVSCYGGVCGTGSNSETDLGLVFGPGIEYRLTVGGGGTPNLGVGGEIRYNSIPVKYGNANHVMFLANATYHFSTRPVPVAHRGASHRRR